MTDMIPQHLTISAEQLGQGVSITINTCGDMSDIAQLMAQSMLAEIVAAQQAGKNATMIIPVGPVDQFPVLAESINQQKIDCSAVMFINMDEYLTPDDQWIDAEHPLSFRGYMNRKFYDLVDPSLAPRAENRVFPDPVQPGALQELIDRRGGVDVCYGGIGINGHIAFNEPPEPGETVSAEQFAALPTRLLWLSRETLTINSVTVGGGLSVIPRRAITVGMKEILASRRVRFYCNRPWQSAVVRRVLHGPITSACPASLLRTHADAELTIAEHVAQPPDIRLR